MSGVQQQKYQRRLRVDDISNEEEVEFVGVRAVPVARVTFAESAQNKSKKRKKADNDDGIDYDEEKRGIPEGGADRVPDPANGPACMATDDSDSDFEYLVRHGKRAGERVEPSTAGTRKRAKLVSLRSMFEGGKKNHDLPRPRKRDPPPRTSGKPAPRPRDPDLVPARWPSTVMHFADNFNYMDIPVPGVAPFAKCACLKRGDCRFGTCENANVHIYCDESCCPFFGKCRNGTRTHDAVQLMRVKNTDIYTLQANTVIPEGVIIGEYLGIVSLVPRAKKDRAANEGYRLHYHADTDVWGQEVLCVDARLGGSLMRFLNHSCDSSTVFHEVANASCRLMVVRTSREIAAGEEICVDYGEDLWFACKCSTCEYKKQKKTVTKE